MVKIEFMITPILVEDQDMHGHCGQRSNYLLQSAMKCTLCLTILLDGTGPQKAGGRVCTSVRLPHYADIITPFASNRWVNSHCRSMCCTRIDLSPTQLSFFLCSVVPLGIQTGIHVAFILSVITSKYSKNTFQSLFHFHAISPSQMVCHKDSLSQHHWCNIFIHHEWSKMISHFL